MFAMHTKQFLSQDTYVKIVGNLPKELEELRGTLKNGRMPVSPYDLLIDFDVKVRDGSVSGGNDDGMLQVFEILSKNPELAAKFDMFRIFETIAKNGGVKDIERFEARQLPNADVASEVQKGNLITTDQAIAEGQI